MTPEATLLLSCLLLLTCFACAAGPGSGEEGAADEASAERPEQAAAGVPAEIRYQEIREPQSGMVQAVSPVPASWEVQPEGSRISMTGPGGVTLYRTETTSFTWSDDPFAQQSARQMGHQVVPPLPLDRVLAQMVEPAARAQGNRLLRSYPVPEIEGFWQRFVAGMVQTGNQRQVRALGTEWTDDRGQRTFVSLVQSITRDPQGLILWTLQTTSLAAPEDAFDEARIAYLYAVGNTRLNPDWQQMANGRLVGQIQRDRAFHDDMMARSRSAHLQRMAAIEQAGRTARQVGNTYSEILDINHAGYLNRDSIQSGGHAATIDAIGERTLIGNHETGEHYRVDAGSNYYWVGNDGRYFGTDDPLYDPRTDQRVNDVEWTKFVTER
jgi:hypothetical protein